MLAANLIGGLIFSGIGFVAFVYGRKQARIKTGVIGLLLCVYPYFIYGTVLIYTIGVVLTICLFVFTE